MHMLFYTQRPKHFRIHSFEMLLNVWQMENNAYDFHFATNRNALVAPDVCRVMRLKKQT